jgi:hypothetical protein
MPLDSLTLFDRINLANCARLRAESSWQDPDRFASEYKSARSWLKYRITTPVPGYRIIETA